MFEALEHWTVVGLICMYLLMGLLVADAAIGTLWRRYQLRESIAPEAASHGCECRAAGGPPGQVAEVMS